MTSKLNCQNTLPGKILRRESSLPFYPILGENRFDLKKTCLLHYPSRYHISSLSSSRKRESIRSLGWHDGASHRTCLNKFGECPEMLQGGGGDGGDFHSRLFLPLSDNLEEITGLLEGPWWRLPCSSSTGGLKSAPLGPSSRNQPRAEPSACGGVLGHVTPPEDHFQAW